MRILTVSLASLLSVSLLACGDDEHDHDHNADAAPASPDAAGSPDAAPQAQAVSIRFAAEVGGQAFACGTSYPGLGTPPTAYVGTDFRFYVSSVLLTPVGGGAGVPVTLTGNDNQADGLALLDFENNTGACQMGSTATYTTLVGTVPPGSYDGISFVVGVPEDKNHLDYAAAITPLNAPGMHWAWRAGYKFLKIDGAIGAAGFNLHLGSTGCPGADPAAPPTSACTNGNRMSIALTGFDPATDTIVADIAPVLATSNLSVNTPMTAPGCMSFPGDPECLPIFPRLGLSYETAVAADQQLFTVR